MHEEDTYVDSTEVFRVGNNFEGCQSNSRGIIVVQNVVLRLKAATELNQVCISTI